MLILCVRLIVARDVQVFDQIFFLSMSVKLFLDEINIWISRLSKADCPAQCGWTSSNLLKSWIELSVEDWLTGNSLSACVWVRISVFSCLWIWTPPETYIIGSSGSQTFRLAWNYTISSPGSLVYQLQILRFFSLHNCMSQSL